MDKYHIEDEKYIILNNSINFENFIINNTPSSINNFLIVSRLVKEKETSILNAIDIFREYHKLEKNSKLTIVGEGSCRNKIENACKDICDSVKMLGARNDILDIMMKNDVLIGLDRCVLEAIATKRIAVISGYEEIRDIVLPENIEESSKHNFSGNNLEINTAANIANKLKSLDKEKIENIVNYNYSFAFENLNSCKNIYMLDEEEKIKIDKNVFWEFADVLMRNLIMKNEYVTKVYNDSKEAQRYFESQIDNLEKNIDSVKKENAVLKAEKNKLEKYITDINNNKLIKIILKLKNKKSNHIK